MYHLFKITMKKIFCFILCFLSFTSIFSKNKNIKIEIPKPVYEILEFSENGLPGIAVVNSSLKNINSPQIKEVFAWYCSIIIDFEECANQGMPTQDEVRIIEEFEDFLGENIEGNPIHPNGLFAVRITHNKSRQLIWMLNDPKPVHDFLQSLINEKKYKRKFDYLIERDENWKNITTYHTGQ